MYGDIKEAVPPNAPSPLGKEVEWISGCSWTQTMQETSSPGGGFPRSSLLWKQVSLVLSLLL